MSGFIGLDVCTESLGYFGRGGCLRFRDREENGGDLEDIVEVLFGSRSVLQELVFVAGQLKALLACGGVLAGYYSIRTR